MDGILFSAPIELGEDKNESVIDVLMSGAFHSTRYGAFEITEQDVDGFVQEFDRSNAANRRPVDFDHRGSKGDTRAAGWIQSLFRDGNKLKAQVRWTKAGKDAILNEEYRFISAEYANAKRSKTTGKSQPVKWLRAATLTNRPFIDNMEPVALSEDDSYLAVPLYAGEETETKKESGYMPKLREILGLADDADDKAVEAAVTALKDASVKLTEDLAAATKLAEDKTEVVSLADFEAVKAKAEAAEKQLHNMERDNFLGSMIRKGKLTPAETEAFKLLYDANEEAAKAALEARPESRMLSEVGTGQDGQGAADPRATGNRADVDTAVRKLMADKPGLSYGEALLAVGEAV